MASSEIPSHLILLSVQGLCDARAQETLAAKREGDKCREEGRQLDHKLTAANTKLKAEADAHRLQTSLFSVIVLMPWFRFFLIYPALSQ